ncbi:unnamed protein product [Cylicocyclus nassatus]|uniref:Uncharacterized protein n=1 Tax=Cylicocyclus nassatus TaxID=53992 RepID=A0AA36DQD7_CYLNA|nr:unnamed protein product [Cylicocyclus nassatus]
MCHPRHLCFTLSVILCIGAACGWWDDYRLKPSVRNKIGTLLKGKKAQYDRKLEELVEAYIFIYASIHDPDEIDVTKLMDFVSEYEKSFSQVYFWSKNQMYMYIVQFEGKVNCARLPRKPRRFLSPHKSRGYLCFIEEADTSFMPIWLFENSNF